MAGFLPKKCLFGCHHLSSPTSIDFGSGEGDEPLDTYTKISGTFEDGDGCNNGFVYDGSGKITYTGHSGARLLFVGASDLKTTMQTEIYYALYLNGSLVSNAQTPHTFSAVSKISNISITNILKLDKGDYLEIYIKSDTACTITIDTLFLSFIGE